MLYYVKQGERGATPLQPLQRALTEEDVDTLISCLPEMIQADVLIVDRVYESLGQADSRADVLALGRDGTVFVVQFRQRIADSGELKAIERAATLSGATLEQLAQLYAESSMHGARAPTPDAATKMLRKYLGGDALGPEPRIVVLAPDFTQELRTTASWLRGRGVDISCVSFQAYDLGGTWLLDVGSDGASGGTLLGAPAGAASQAGSGAAPAPSAASAEEPPGGNGKATRAAPAAATDEGEQSRLLAAVEAMLQADPLDLPMTSGLDSLAFPTGFDGISFDVRVRRSPSSLVEISLSLTSEKLETNRALAKQILGNQARLEREMGETVIVKDPWYRNWVKISVYRELDLDDEAGAEEVVSTLRRFVSVLAPRVNKVAARLARARV